ncbi:MAG TPA: FAD-binding oxidoreductase [Bryobacteraceae bacterium]|nr:FAD-binding oxidoreductase [Bryobacteraceae bacterium]
MSWSYLEDASGAKGRADRICVPADEAELLALLAEARQEKAAVTVAGGGSGLTGGRVPNGGWVISMEKFRRLDIRSGSATVGAGVTLHDLHAAAKSSNQFYPPDPTETMAFLGGTISCNSSGSRSFKYGATRRWIQRLRVALVDGQVLDVRRGDAIDFDVPVIPQPESKKHSAGYPLRPGMDWIDLFTGSEGTLAVVIEADVTLLPNPSELLNGIVFFPSDEAAHNALDTWRAIPNLRMLEYVDDPALRMIEQRYPDVPSTAHAALIVEQIIESDADLDAWADRLAAAGAFEEQSWFGSSDRDRERFRKFRHALPETSLAISQKNGFPSLGTDFSVPVPRNREMFDFYREHMERIMPGHYCIFGHVGDAHPHVNMLPATQTEFDAGTEALMIFARKAASLGGSVAAEHGLGKRKAKFLPIQYSAEQIEAMKAVKRRLDPDWRLSPGTLFELS